MASQSDIRIKGIWGGCQVHTTFNNIHYVFTVTPGVRGIGFIVWLCFDGNTGCWTIINDEGYNLTVTKVESFPEPKNI